MAVYQLTVPPEAECGQKYRNYKIWNLFISLSTFVYTSEIEFHSQVMLTIQLKSKIQKETFKCPLVLK
jgi:hypothetical protein